MTKTDDSEIDELRAAIAKMTGRETVSRDLRYLRERITMLKERKREGEDVAAPRAQGHVVMSVSMHTDSRDATAELAAKMKVGTSALVRRALALYARTHGHDALATAIVGEEV